MTPELWTALQPILAQGARDGLRLVGMFLATHGFIQAGAGVESFIGAGMTLAGLFWGWWTTKGAMQAMDLLKHVTGRVRPADAIATAKLAPEASAIPKVLLLAALATGLLSFAPGDVYAQGASKREFQITGNPIADIKANIAAQTGNTAADSQALWSKLVAASIDDLNYASAMAGAAGTPASKQRKQCWDAIIVLNKQANGIDLKDANGQPLTRPNPQIFTDAEGFAEVIDNLSPQGALFTSCAGAAEMAKANVIQFVTAVVTGAAGLAKLGLP